MLARRLSPSTHPAGSLLGVTWATTLLRRSSNVRDAARSHCEGPGSRSHSSHHLQAMRHRRGCRWDSRHGRSRLASMRRSSRPIPTEYSGDSLANSYFTNNARPGENYGEQSFESALIFRSASNDGVTTRLTRLRARGSRGVSPTVKQKRSAVPAMSNGHSMMAHLYGFQHCEGRFRFQVLLDRS